MFKAHSQVLRRGKRGEWYPHTAMDANTSKFDTTLNYGLLIRMGDLLAVGNRAYLYEKRDWGRIKRRESAGITPPTLICPNPSPSKKKLRIVKILTRRLGKKTHLPFVTPLPRSVLAKRVLKAQGWKRISDWILCAFWSSCPFMQAWLRAYKSREDRTAIKLRLGKANLVRFWDKTASQVLI